MQIKNEDSRRKFLVDALGLGLFAGVNAAGIYQSAYALGDLPGRLPKGQSIYRLKGEVIVDGKLASLKTQIGSNSQIRTGKDGEVVFVVASDAFILRRNSELKLGASSTIIETMRMVSGAILGVFGQRQSSHRLQTSTATIGIRGTGIYVESDPEKSYVCTCYGHTQITASADPNIRRDILTQYHDQPVYILPSASQQKLIVPAPVINHDDTELALVESLVGRETPFANSGGGYKK